MTGEWERAVVEDDDDAGEQIMNAIRGNGRGREGDGVDGGEEDINVLDDQR
jgi:hypothetical protein